MSAAPASHLSWRTAWRIARRDLDWRLRGLHLLIVCLFLGVGSIAAIGTLTGSIERELSARGRQILGADLEAEVWQRPPDASELRAFAALGRVSAGARMQAILSANGQAAPVALKAVDQAWPLYGRLTLTDGRMVGAPPAGSMWIAQGTAERLGAGKGDTVAIGGMPLIVGGVIAHDPEQLGEGFVLGAPAIVRADMPGAAGLTAPGAMYRSKLRVALPAGSDPQAATDALQARFPDAGFTFRTRDKAAPGAERFVSRMGQFLVLVGLAALVIAGIGIGGGVGSWLEARRGAIATLKILGAASADIARIHAMQIAVAALAGSAAGLAAGVAVTPLLAAALGDLLPVSSGLVVDAPALAKAAAYGLLVALIFAAPPLARARLFPAMALMRAHVARGAPSPRAALVPVAAGLALVVALALASTASLEVTAWFIAGTFAVLAALAAIGWLVRRAAAALPHAASPLLRAGLANLHRPGAQTVQLVTALGFGLSAFVMLAAMATSLDRNISARVPARAPDWFLLDVPQDAGPALRRLVAEVAPGARVRTVPAMRGAILAYGPADAMTRVADMAEIPDDAWQLRGERGLTYAEDVPEGNSVTAGRWWPRGYAGPPLVSIDEKLADATGLEVGDRITVGLLGVERSATIASLRRIDWDSMGFNYVLVFSPNALHDAPHKLAATIDLPPGARPPGLMARLVTAFPTTSVIETGAILRDARAILTQMSGAILAAASVAVLAGLAVLAGAIAAARARQAYESVILRVLGASRAQILVMKLAEYGVLTAAMAAVALALGTAMAWVVIVRVFEFDWLPGWPEILGVLGAGCLLVMVFALAGTLPLLRTRPASALREL